MESETPYQIKQVLIFRKDLKMRTGKIVAQCTHAALNVFLTRVPLQLTETEQAWVDSGYAKICLSVDTEADLLRLRDLAQERGIPHSLVTDQGRTEFHGVPTVTALALGPDSKAVLDPLCGPNGLIPCRLA